MVVLHSHTVLDFIDKLNSKTRKGRDNIQPVNHLFLLAFLCRMVSVVIWCYVTILYYVL